MDILEGPHSIEEHWAAIQKLPELKGADDGLDG